MRALALKLLGAATALALAPAGSQAALEKTELTLGFIKLTDCAPLVIASELGSFEAEGLSVALEPRRTRRSCSTA